MPSVLGDFLSWSYLGIPAFLFVITVVIFFHELGHFAVARAFGVAVQVFSIGFGRELAGWTDRKGTRWKICALPLGGYVKFAGDADVSSRPDEEGLREMDASQRATALHTKPLYQRALVAAAGPLANFVLAIVIFTALFMVIGRPAQPPIVDQITPGSAAEIVGMLHGDIIRTVDGEPIETFDQLRGIVGARPSEVLRIGIERDGRAVEFDAIPQSVDVAVLAGEPTRVGRLGITNLMVPAGPVDSFGRGVGQTWFIVQQTMIGLGELVIGRGNPDDLAGPLGIAKISGDVAAQGVMALFSLLALISVSIGLINLFPIPVLDGGHLLYYAFEALLGRPLGERAQEIGFRMGLALVLSLMLFATFNDLVRFNLF